jgi:transcriptional regulator with XRE-family HTH domain
MESFAVLRKNINALLEQRGWSQPELAKRADLDQKTINNIVSERISISSTKLSTVERIAEAFGVTIEEMLGDVSGRKVIESADVADEIAILVRNYLFSHPDGRKAILRLSDSEAKIAQSSNQ